MATGPSLAEKLAEDVWFRIIARGAMILATFVFLPLAGILINHYLSNQELAVAELREATTNIKLLRLEVADYKQAKDDQIGNLKDRVDDHERRIRTLETSSVNQTRKGG